MGYIPSEQDLNQYGEKKSSLAKSYKDYLQGYGTQLLQSGAMGGYHIANTILHGLNAVTGTDIHPPKPDVTEFIPHSEAGQTGKHVGESVSDLVTALLPARLGLRGLQALSRYHPFTKGQIGRQHQGPFDAAEEAGIRHYLSPRDFHELDTFLEHPGLERGGGTGRSLTPLGRQAIMQGISEGRPSAIHSGQSNLGYLERAIPALGESELASRYIRPLKDRMNEGFQQSMRNGGLEEQADRLRQAREGAARYYRTQRGLKKIGKAVGKPLSIGALIKAALTGAKGLP